MSENSAHSTIMSENSASPEQCESIASQSQAAADTGDKNPEPVPQDTVEQQGTDRSTEEEGEDSNAKKCADEQESHQSCSENETDSIDFFKNWNKPLLECCREEVLDKAAIEKALNYYKTQRESELPVESVDCVDKDGYGAIHYLIIHKHKEKEYLIEQLVILGEANVNLTTTKEGYTALHLAVEHDDVESVKALISVDADVNKEDLMGKTPLDITNVRLKRSPSGDYMMQPLKAEELSVSKDCTAEDVVAGKIRELLLSVGARRGSSVKKQRRKLKKSMGAFAHSAHVEVAKFQKINTEYYKTHDEILERVKDESWLIKSHEAVALVEKMRALEKYRRTCGSRILCLDGGGIRGLIQMTVLGEIERRTGKKIVELFDWIVGTSTGGIIALALCYGPKGQRKTVQELRNIYWKMKDDIFGAAQNGLLGFLARGNTKKLQELLQLWLGEDTTLGAETYPKVLIPAVNKKDSKLDLHFFNNCFDDEYSTELVWKVARYTSAAPFYFKEFENYIDGGMLCNNPSEAALTTIQDFYHHQRKKIPVSMVVSIGSGINPGSPLGTIDIKSNPLNPKVYSDLMEVLGAAVVGNRTHCDCATRCREQGISYYRFNPHLTRNINPDQQDSKILKEMVWTTRQYMNEHRDDMDRLVQQLKESELTST